jgi:hypothetical protein
MEKSLCSEMNLLEVGLTFRVFPDREKLPVPPTIVPPILSLVSVGSTAAYPRKGIIIKATNTEIASVFLNITHAP